MKDRTQLINGFLFFVLLILTAISFITLADTTGSKFLFYIVVVLAMVFALFMLLGGVAIIAISFGSSVLLLKREGRKLSNLLSLLSVIGIIMKWEPENNILLIKLLHQKIVY